jgi:hypothetical protein
VIATHPLPSNDRCLQSHYLAEAVVKLFISWSLHSNGSTCHIIITIIVAVVKVIAYEEFQLVGYSALYSHESQQRFRKTCRFHLHSRSVRQEKTSRSRRKARLLGLLVDPEGGGHMFLPPKHLDRFELHGVTTLNTYSSFHSCLNENLKSSHES